MTHDEFVESIAESAGWAGDEASLAPSSLSPAAQAHALECGECARLLAGLTRLRADALSPGDVATPIEGDYWASFNSRLAARLPRRPATHARLRVPLRLAAATLLGAIILFTWRTWHASEPTEAAAALPSMLETMAPEEIEAALSVFSPSGLDGASLAPELVDDGDGDADAAAPLGDPGGSASDLDGPVESLEAELSDDMSEAEQLELMRRLMEASS